MCDETCNYEASISFALLMAIVSDLTFPYTWVIITTRLQNHLHTCYCRPVSNHVFWFPFNFLQKLIHWFLNILCERSMKLDIIWFFICAKIQQSLYHIFICIYIHNTDRYISKNTYLDGKLMVNSWGMHKNKTKQFIFIVSSFNYSCLSDLGKITFNSN